MNNQVNKIHHITQMEKMATLGTMASGVIHEINTPLAYVSANINALSGYFYDMLSKLDHYENCETQRVNDNSKLRCICEKKNNVNLDLIKQDLPDLLRETRDGISLLKKTVLELGKFSHPERGRKERFDLHKVLESAISISNAKIRNKAVVVKELGDIPLVNLIRNQIIHVFINILVNAAHSINSFGEIRIRTGRSDEGVFVDIVDNGRGMSPEECAHVFDAFFTTKPIGQGTGLGLSLAQEIMQNHGGTIGVKSELGKGTRFRVTLPVE